VLLVPGVGVVGEGWRPQLDGLADRYALVAFDNRGIGGSAILDGVLSIEAMAADALALADHAGFERFHLAGHSMGGLVAQHVALEAPQRVHSLALLCSLSRGGQGVRLTPGMLLAALRWSGTIRKAEVRHERLVMQTRRLD
jgi:pimeloyl-ACP methyl ester carboxylesterase